MNTLEKSLPSIEIPQLVTNQRAKTDLKWLHSNNVTMAESSKPGIMEYRPEMNRVFVGGDLKKLIEAGDTLALSIALVHETTHAKHMHMSKEQEVKINDLFISAITGDPTLKEQIAKFRAELYRINPGYLAKHIVEKSNIRFVENGEIGLKDDRTAKVDTPNGIMDIYLSPFVSEFLAYASTAQDPELYESATGPNRKSKNLVIIASEVRAQIISTHPELLEAMGGTA